MNIVIAPEHTLLFISILLLSGLLTSYILYDRHDRAQAAKLVVSNTALIRSVNGLVATMNKVLNQNEIDKAVAEHSLRTEPPVE